MAIDNGDNSSQDDCNNNTTPKKSDDNSSKAIDNDDNSSQDDCNNNTTPSFPKKSDDNSSKAIDNDDNSSQDNCNNNATSSLPLNSNDESSMVIDNDDHSAQDDCKNNTTFFLPYSNDEKVINDEDGNLTTQRITRFMKARPKQNRGISDRLIDKYGRINVKRKVPERWSLYSRDLFTTIMNAPMKTNVAIFFVTFLVSWWFFGIIWWIIGAVHGDFTPQHLLWHQIGNYTPCVQNCDGFWDALLFSIETQTTIGYGVRAVTQKCPEGIILLQLQTIIGYLIDAFALGIFFAKLSQSKYRTNTLTASNQAVIAKRNNVLKLMIRIGDLRKNPICQVQVNGFLYMDTVTKEGEELICHPYLIEFQPSYVHLLTPLIVCHTIDDQSPFYEITSEDLKLRNAELVIFVEGVIESTGQTTQYRTSYKHDEFIYDCYFRKIAERDQYGRLKIHYSRFHETNRFEALS